MKSLSLVRALCGAQFSLPKNHAKRRGFSLVEMLMALLVASILLAALAPVMTRRMSEPDINVVTTGGYEKDSVVTIFTNSEEQQEFNIPTDASRVTITMAGGGGAGGDAIYGNRTITENGNFIVPDNVKKLRVFMVGGGGGGASGGMGTGKAYGTVPAIESTYQTITTAGSYTFADVITPTTHVAPELAEVCSRYGTSEWTVASNATIRVNPGANIPKVDRKASVTLSKATLCGGGGGGAGIGGGGGSGGYLADKKLSSTVTAGNLAIIVGEGGGGTYSAGKGGAGCCTGGAEGGASKSSIYAGKPGSNGSGGDKSGWGAGGGGGTGIKVRSSNQVITEIGGGGGGGGHTYVAVNSSGTTYFAPTDLGGWNISSNSGSSSGGSGGGGGGYGAGGGGGAPYLVVRADLGCNGAVGTQGSPDGTGGILTGRTATTYTQVIGGAGYGGGGGGGAGSYIDNPYYETKSCTYQVFNGSANNGSGGGGGGYRFNKYPSGTPYVYGGGGGGGTEGVGGTGGTNGIGGKLASSIFNSDTNCSGGTIGTRETAEGKPGAIKIWYSTKAVENGLVCEYTRPSNGGGGGGAGQVWMGEINVTPKQKISFKIGQGGAVQTEGAQNGNGGTDTSITVGGTTYTATGGRGGIFEANSTFIRNSGGQGGGLNNTNFSTSAVYRDWLELGKITSLTGGNDGEQGYLKTSAEDGKGGAGGSILKTDGTYLEGGAGGTGGGNGSDATKTNYGAGGGGGAGGVDGSFGTGGKGANGFIYIEWGGVNGGGGTNGEIIQKVLTNFDGSDRKMLINIGKGGDKSNGEDTRISVRSGGKNVTLTARGGIKGAVGKTDTYEHGGETAFPDAYDELYKDYVQNGMSIISGQAASDDYGGMGGYLACIYNTRGEDGNKQCMQTIKANDGVDNSAGPIRPGCGGTSITLPTYNICQTKTTFVSPHGGNGAFSGGGGGGAVLEKTAGEGGQGGDGFVILEYKSVQ